MCVADAMGHSQQSQKPALRLALVIWSDQQTVAKPAETAPYVAGQFAEVRR